MSVTWGETDAQRNARAVRKAQARRARVERRAERFLRALDKSTARQVKRMGKRGQW